MIGGQMGGMCRTRRGADAVTPVTPAYWIVTVAPLVKSVH
jgi:hypothetical protein